MHRPGSVTALVTAALLCAAARAQADGDEPDFGAARAHYRAAQEAAREGRWGEAAEAYTAAFEITEDPVLHFRIADAYQHAGQCERALEHYERYVQEADPPDAYAELALRQSHACQDEILAEREQAAGDPGDGDEAPTGGTGEADGEAASPPPSPGEAGPRARGGPAAPADGNSPTAADAALAFPQKTWHRGAAWTATGLAIVATATSGILAASASDREDDLERLFRSRDPATGSPFAFEGHLRARYEALVREGENLALASRIALGAAGAATVTAAILFLVDPTRGAPAPAGPARGGARAATVAPGAPGGGFGLTARWTF